MELILADQLNQVNGAEDAPADEIQHCEYLALINALLFLADKGIIKPSVASYYITKYCEPEEAQRILGQNL